MNTQLNRRISEFYDTSSTLWENMWGEHMHHGYYGADGQATVDHYQAQLDLIEELLKWGGIQGAKRIYDIGCGIGGSALYLAQEYKAEVTGITLSNRQQQRATERAKKHGLSDTTRFVTGDALDYTAGHNCFDLVWSMESGEHLPNKPAFLQTVFNHLAPGGAFLMATWCHRSQPPELTESERNFLDKLCDAYHLPPLVSIDTYHHIAKTIGFREINSADWTTAVAPFWPAVVKSALSWQGISGLLKAGLPAIRGALAMRYMISGYRSGLVCFQVFKGRKP